MRRLVRAPLAAVVATLSLAPVAHAAGFDPVTGRVDVSDAAFAINFDDEAALVGAGVQSYGFPNFEPIDPAVTAAALVPEGLEGDGALALGGSSIYSTVAFTTVDLAGRRTELVLWQKPRGTRLTPNLTWYGSLTADEPTFLGSIALMPTGRATDDGWEEWSTGPFDWAWAGAYGPVQMTFADEQLAALYVGGSYDVASSALLDALYVRDLGPAEVADSTCTLGTEAAVCGDAGACHLGRCVDAAVRMGASPPTDAGWRADYIDRRVAELDLFEGGRNPQTKMQAVRDLMADVRTSDSARAYWGTLAQAYTLLEDGHASAPLVGYPAYANLGVCLHEGEADLLPGAPVAPMVFSTTQDNPLAAQLEPGDVLVAIDGLEVDAWVAQAGRLLQHHGDPDAASVILAPSILTAALDTGAELTFARCAGPAACTADDSTAIVLDLSQIGSDVLAGVSVPYLDTSAPCDYRFVRPVDGSLDVVTAYEFADAQDADGIRSLLINGVPSYYGQGGEEWFDAVQSALANPLPLLLLDQRTGGGGGVDAVDWIAGFLLETEAVYGMDFLPTFDDGDDAATLAVIRSCATGVNEGYDCGGSFRWVLGDVAQPTRGTAATSKLAVLNGLDVSGNDYLSRLIIEREQGDTRIFGPTDTFGAFGVIWSLANHLGELSGGSFQVHDTLFLQSASDDNTDFVTSYGVPPDELVRQKQSDALLGRDTVLEAARTWLNTP